MAIEVMDKVRREELLGQRRVVRAAMGAGRKAIRGVLWRMRKDDADWSVDQQYQAPLATRDLKRARA